MKTNFVLLLLAIFSYPYYVDLNPQQYRLFRVRKPMQSNELNEGRFLLFKMHRLTTTTTVAVAPEPPEPPIVPPEPPIVPPEPPIVPPEPPIVPPEPPVPPPPVIPPDPPTAKPPPDEPEPPAPTRAFEGKLFSDENKIVDDFDESDEFEHKQQLMPRKRRIVRIVRSKRQNKTITKQK